ncbi:MAG TPA: folate family ECF transporter S component [Tissierellia bacterium]|nr:folate family ECF transporter S component [Tissierellia bacterium]
MRKVSRARRLTAFALLIALQIILTRFLSIQTPVVRISFFFVPIAISAILFGPWVAGMLAAVADVMGFFLNPVGTFHPGFILSAFLTGVVYGLFLYRKEVTWLRIALAALMVSLLINLGLNSLWLSQILGQGVWGLIIGRVIKEAVLFVVQIPVILVSWQALKRPLRRYQTE